MMVWEKMIRRLVEPAAGGRRKRSRRRLLLEHLTRRELLASDIGAVSGIAFVDQAGDGLTSDDPRLEGIQVQLYEDTNGNGTLETSGSSADTLIGSDTTASSSDPVPGQYRFDGLSPGDYLVVQESVSGLVSPDPQLVNVTNDSGVQVALIDDYSETDQIVSANSGSPTVSDSVAAPEAIGGERDIQANHTSGSTNVDVVVDSTADELSVSAGAGTEGSALIQYDGVDGAITLDAAGLGGVSLAGGSAGDSVDPNSGFVISSFADNTGAEVTVRIYSSATDFSTATAPIPTGSAPIETLLKFSSFTVGGGAGADFNDVGAIEASITAPAAVDSFVSIVETIQPDVATANLSNTQLVQLGGQVFRDDGASGGTQNNGLRESSEAGVENVMVSLYELADPNGSVDPATDTPIATTTTDATGTYNFADLDPGHYVVNVTEANFSASAPLFGFSTSTGNEPTPDPDDNVDDDDNGDDVAGLGTASGVITLVSNSEPTDDDDSDSNTNTTVDLGFYPQIDLQVDKTLDENNSDSFIGGSVVFDIVVTNNGPLDATNVVVEDVIPDGLTFDSIQNASTSVNSTVAGSTLTVEFGTLAAGVTESFQLVATIDSGQTADVTNTATVTGDQVDLDSSNNSSGAAVDVSTADLRLEKTASPDPVNAGDTLVYTITVTNDGPQQADGVVVTDPLPSGVTFVGGDVDGDTSAVSFDTGTGNATATVGTLASGASATVTLTVDVDQDLENPLSNTATVSSDPDNDPDSSNNTSTDETAVDRVVDVAVDKTVTGTAVAGGTMTYTVNVSNSGPGEARGISIADTLVSDLTFDSFDAGTSGVTLSQNGQDLTFDVGTLAAGVSETFTFDVSIASSASGTISNTVDATTTDTDSDATNNGDTVDVEVQQENDLVIAKTVDLSTAVPGQDQLVYTITVSHDSDSLSDATAVVVSDVLPSGLTGQTISATTADATDFDTATRTATVTYDSIPVGESRTFTITANIAEDATGTIDNPAEVTAEGTDIDETNNAANVVTTLQPEYDVTISKSVDEASPIPGDTIVYTIDVTNAGPSTATGVTLSDDIPNGLTFVSGSFDGQSASVNGETISFPAISVADDETVSATLTFTVESAATGTITNTAEVIADNGETDSTNNDDSAQIDVTPQVDVRVEKSVDVEDAGAGDTLVYTVTVTNDGPSPAAAVQAVDTLPAGVTFVSGTGPGGEALSESGGTVTVDGGQLADDDSFSFTINVTVDSGASGELVNEVVVTTDTADTDSSNNSAQSTTTADPLSSSIAGSVYIDANNNGTRDSGEAGIAGVEVVLTGTDVLGNQIDRSVTTDENGDYLFDELAAGTYEVAETQPFGFQDAEEEVGTGATATAGDDFFTELGLAADTEATGFNFGELDQPLSKRRFLASS